MGPALGGLVVAPEDGEAVPVAPVGLVNLAEVSQLAVGLDKWLMEGSAKRISLLGSFVLEPGPDGGNVGGEAGVGYAADEVVVDLAVDSVVVEAVEEANHAHRQLGLVLGPIGGRP